MRATPARYSIAFSSMGHCASREEKDQKKLNRRIEDQIRKDQSMSLRIIKLLLLGEWRSCPVCVVHV